MPFLIDSPAFEDGHSIPPKYARDGDNLSPPLQWRGVPPGAQSLALVVEDPDAPNGTFHHWLLYNINPAAGSLPEGVRNIRALNLGCGVNDFGKPRYDGPQPPKGDRPHHYHFRLMALDVPDLNLPPSAKAEEVLTRAREHEIGEAELVGTFESRAGV